MRIRESKLRRTIRRAILINEGKVKDLANEIKDYVMEVWRTEDPRDAKKFISVEAIEAKFRKGIFLDEENGKWQKVKDRLYKWENGGPQDGYWYEDPRNQY